MMIEDDGGLDHESNRLPRLALLIDADNISPKPLPWILEEIAVLGKPVIFRCYGNFRSSQLRPWAQAAALHGIETRHHETSGLRKNVSDVLLTIETMDLLHGGEIDAFCLVTGDADFTPLVIRIRQQGLNVYGFGGTGASTSLQSACTAFKFVEGLIGPPKQRTSRRRTFRPANEAVALFRKVLKELPSENGWIPLDQFESLLHQTDPYFDSRHFG